LEKSGVCLLDFALCVVGGELILWRGITDLMKKACCWRIAVLFFLPGLVSCVDRGRDDLTGYALGVLSLDQAAGFYLMNVQDTVAVYCPEFKDRALRGEMEVGGCYYFVYVRDNTLPENAPHAVRANGYVTASLAECHAAARYGTHESLIDTSMALPGEIPVSDVKPSDRVFGYSDGYLFMTHKTVLPEGDFALDWSLSYDAERMMPITVGNKNYYDLFLRATLVGGGDGSFRTDTAAVEHYSFNAYRLGEFLTGAAGKEKEYLQRLNSAYNASSTFTVRIHFASAIAAEDGTIGWKSVEFPAKIAYFVPD
jgi:hypothetical protein